MVTVDDIFLARSPLMIEICVRDIDDLLDVIFCGMVLLSHTTFGGDCSVLTPVSSTLYIFCQCGLSLITDVDDAPAR